MNYQFWVIFAFIANGMSLLGNKLVSKMHYDSYLPQVLLGLYGFGFIIGILINIKSKKRIEKNDVLTGVLAGLGSMIGVFCAIGALTKLPGHVGYPLISGTSLVLVSIAGTLIFKEKIGIYGILGIACGALAIVLLSI